MKKSDLKKSIFVKKGKIRSTILKHLTEPKTATELAKELNKHRSSISRALLDLEKQGLVKCVNPEDDKFRHYVKK